MADSIEAVGPGTSIRFDPPGRARVERSGTVQREERDPSAPRIQDSVTSRRIKDGVNAPGQMGPLSPAEHRIVEKVQESLESDSGSVQSGSDHPRGGRIDILA